MGVDPRVGPARLARRVEVETPEQVTLGLELAGVGSRALAALIDVLLVVLVGILATIALGFTAGVLESPWAVAILILVNVAILWGYFALFEGLWNGRTPGKRRAGIRVIMDTGHPITLQAALTRNLVRIVDLQPGVSGLAGALCVALHPQAKRLGDLVAGTIVVRDEIAQLGRAAPVSAGDLREAPAAALAPAARLGDEEFQLLDRYLRRAGDLPPDVRRRFGAELAARLAARFPEQNPISPRFLTDVHAAEQAARQAPGAARPAATGARLRIADRFVALRQARWEAFRRRAVALEREGLSSLTGDEVLAFAADYRATAADLARAVTYGVDERTVAQLEGMAAAGHNALYGMRKARRSPTHRLLLGELPAAAVRRARYVAAAALLFLLPGVAGFALVRERPAIAREILPDVMLARAESGQGSREAGVGYAESPSPYLPIVASGIIANNVQVAIGAFAFGVTAGIGTVLLLGFNGVFFGAVLGHFVNVGLAAWILTFVAGHGVLELTAIFLAGGAGLLLARALLAPGDLARRDALVLYGREAARLVILAAALLVLAGTIEGLLSASGAAAGWKVGVSAASAVLLVLLWMAGRRALAAGG